MKSTLELNKYRIISGSLFDIIVILSILVITTVSHFISAFPLFVLEPIRIAILLSMLYTSRYNSIILAVILPLFSSVISSHPELFKSLIMCVELMSNVLIYNYICNRKINRIYPIFVSIVLSKILYYILKTVLLYLGLMHGQLLATNIFIQMAITVILSGAFFLLNKKIKN